MQDGYFAILRDISFNVQCIKKLVYYISILRTQVNERLHIKSYSNAYTILNSESLIVC